MNDSGNQLSPEKYLQVCKDAGCKLVVSHTNGDEPITVFHVMPDRTESISIPMKIAVDTHYDIWQQTVAPALREHHAASVPEPDPRPATTWKENSLVGG